MIEFVSITVEDTRGKKRKLDVDVFSKKPDEIKAEVNKFLDKALEENK